MRQAVIKLVGVKPKNTTFNELTQLLSDSGYNYKEVCLNLNISPKNYYAYFREPRNLSIEKLQRISYMTLTPLPKIINLTLSCSKKSKHWFSDDSLPVDEHLELLKLKSKKVKV